MLRPEINQRITQTGPGTPAGELLRAYWQPVALAAELERRNPLQVTVLGETLALFRDGGGQLGLLEDRCAHRGTSLSAGSVDMRTSRLESCGLRCCYHGWLYGRDGQCLEQPGEPPEHRYAERIRIQAYPVREAWGFIWAYLGEGESPALLPVDAAARTDGYRVNTLGVWPCNYFQVCENLVDPVHATVLHKSTEFEKPFEALPQVRCEITSYGLRVHAGRPGYERQTELLMPTVIRLALPFMDPVPQLAFWVVPDTDTRCRSFHAWFLPFADGMPAADREAAVERFRAFLYEQDDSDPLYHATRINAQDKYACASQGPIADRSREHLGRSDVAVRRYRQLFLDAMDEVARGRAPLGRLPAFEGVVLHFDNVN